MQKNFENPLLARAALSFAEGFGALACYFGQRGPVTLDYTDNVNAVDSPAAPPAPAAPAPAPAQAPAAPAEAPAPAPAAAPAEAPAPAPAAAPAPAPAAPAPAEPLTLDRLRWLVMQAFSSGAGQVVKDFLSLHKVERVTQLDQTAQKALAEELLRTEGVA